MQLLLPNWRPRAGFSCRRLTHTPFPAEVQSNPGARGAAPKNQALLAGRDSPAAVCELKGKRAATLTRRAVMQASSCMQASAHTRGGRGAARVSSAACAVSQRVAEAQGARRSGCARSRASSGRAGPWLGRASEVQRLSVLCALVESKTQRPAPPFSPTGGPITPASRPAGHAACSSAVGCGGRHRGHPAAPRQVSQSGGRKQRPGA